MVPKQIHQGNSMTGNHFGIIVEFCAEDARDVVRQIADQGDKKKSAIMAMGLAEIGTAAFRQHAAKENAEKRAVGVAEDAERDRNDADIRQHDHAIGRG